MKNPVHMLMIMSALTILSGCDEHTNPATNQSGTDRSEPPTTSSLGSPADYFPTATGTRWTYEITVPDFEKRPPLIHRVVTWPRGNGGITYETRGRLMSRFEEAASDGHNRLIMAITGPAAKQGPLEYPEGYELKVERDDLGIFIDNIGRSEHSGNKFFWAISKSERYEVTWIILYDPEETSGAPSGGEWGSFGQEPGVAMRLAFFGDKPGISIGLSGHNDQLLMIGPERFTDMQTLHFRRIVEAGEPHHDIPGQSSDSSFLDKGFTEDMWFAKGLGLVKLVQTVDGTTTMEWMIVR